MSLNTSNREQIAHRRSMVAHKRRFGHTQREIAAALRVSVGTVNSDLRALRRQWMKEAKLDTEVQAAQQLHEIRQVKQWAYLERDGDLYLKAIALEMRLLGTAKTPGVDVNITFLARVVAGVFAEYEGGERTPSAIVEQFMQMMATQAAQPEQLSIIIPREN